MSSPIVTHSCPDALILPYVPNSSLLKAPTSQEDGKKELTGSMIIYDVNQSPFPLQNVSIQAEILNNPPKTNRLDKKHLALTSNINDLSENAQSQFDNTVISILGILAKFLSNIETVNSSFYRSLKSKIHSVAINEQTQTRVSKDIKKNENLQATILKINEAIEERAKSLNQLMERKKAFFNLLNVIAGGKEVSRWHLFSSTYDQTFGYGYEMSQIAKILKKHTPPVISNTNDQSDEISTESDNYDSFMDKMIGKLRLIKYYIQILDKASQISKSPDLFQPYFNQQLEVYNQLENDISNKELDLDQNNLDAGKDKVLSDLKNEVKTLLENRKASNEEFILRSLPDDNPLAESFMNLLNHAFTLHTKASQMSSNWNNLTDKEKADLHRSYQSSFQKLQEEQTNLDNNLLAESKAFSEEFTPTWTYYTSNLQGNLSNIQQTKTKIQLLLKERDRWNLAPVAA